LAARTAAVACLSSSVPGSQKLVTRKTPWAYNCGPEGFRAVDVRFDDAVGEPGMLAWMASQSAYLELALGLQGTHDCASLLPRRADHGDQFLAVR